MQFLTGTIDRDTVRDLMPGTIFGLRQQGYSNDKEYICVVDSIDWQYEDGSDRPLDTSNIVYSYMEVGISYSLQIKQDSATLSAPVWEKIVHVEPEMALYEFFRQSTLAHAEVHRHQASLLEAQARMLSYDGMQDRIGV